MTTPLERVAAERERQDARWGLQRHTWPEWMTILTEEVGEAAQAANHAHWSKNPTPSDLAELERLLRDELVQVAAVAVAMIERLDERL